MYMIGNYADPSQEWWDLLGSTLVLWSSKIQGAVASSTYAAEFTALHNGIEEIVIMRYMLYCLGIHVVSASKLF